VTEVVQGEGERGGRGNGVNWSWRGRSDSTLAASAKRMLLGHVLLYKSR